LGSTLISYYGAYVKTPIDLTTNKKAFGDKQGFNGKTLLLTIPKLVLPLVLFWIGDFFFNEMAGYFMVALAGVVGFAFKDLAFKQIEKVYKKEKYKTLSAYREKAA